MHITFKDRDLCNKMHIIKYINIYAYTKMQSIISIDNHEWNNMPRTACMEKDPYNKLGKKQNIQCIEQCIEYLPPSNQ